MKILKFIPLFSIILLTLILTIAHLRAKVILKSADICFTKLGHSIDKVQDNDLTDVCPVVPGEFQPQSCLILNSKLFNEFPEIFRKIISKTPMTVCIIVSSDEEKLQIEDRIIKNGLSLSFFEIVVSSYDSIWIRDYGPISVQNANKSIGLLDCRYTFMGRPKDDDIPLTLGKFYELPVYRVPIEVEGGNLLSNGNGLFITTKRLLEDNENVGINEEEVKIIFRKYFGCKEIVFLEYLEGEDSGHVDMFATFTSSNTVVIGKYDDSEDPTNAELLDRNSNLLKNIHTDIGPLMVRRIPMPSNRDGIWRTYTNVIYANGILFLPYYSNIDDQKLNAAIELYSSLLPGWKIEKIEATKLLKDGGALHCIGLNMVIDNWKPGKRIFSDSTSNEPLLDPRVGPLTLEKGLH